MTAEQVMEGYELAREDDLACIAYEAEMSRERCVEIPLGKTP
jgi:hypothetical protein